MFNLLIVNIEGYVNKNGGFLEILIDMECDYFKMGMKIIIVFDR